MRKTQWKKIASFILSLMLVFGMCFSLAPEQVEAADDVTFTVESDKKDLQRGDTVTVTVSMSGNETAVGIQYDLKFDDTMLEFVEAGEGAAIDELDRADLFALNVPVNVPDSVRLIIGRPSKALPNGELFTVTFKVKDTAKGACEFTSEVELLDVTDGVVSNTIDDNTDGTTVSVAATAIALNKSTLTLVKGASEQLIATLTPADATSKVTWTSTDSNIVTVDSEGKVQAVAAGKATITAAANGHTASCEVTVTSPLSSIEIKGDEDTLLKGESTQLRVVYDPADTTDNKTVTWTSSDNNVATVDQNGLVKALAEGTVTITATVGGKTDTYEITVVEIKLNGIALNKTTADLHRGDTIVLSVIYDPSNTTDSKTVTWKSSDTSVATVDANGKVTAVNAGTATITATVGNHSAECTVTVDVPLKGIVVEKAEIDLVKNQFATILYTLNPADTTDAKVVTFASDNTAVATVDANGVVKALKAGKAVITLTGANNITATVVVNVTEIPIDTVVLDKLNITLEAGESDQLTAIVKPENTTDDDKSIVWSSSDETVATVDANGKVTAVKGGTATITATAWNGVKATCEVFVPIHLEGITLDKTTAEIHKGESITLNITYNPANTTDDKTVTWKSSDASVATVDANGKVTAVNVGTAVITATVGNYSAECTVTVDAPLKGIVVEKAEIDLVKNQFATILYTLNPTDTTDAKVVTFASDNTEVATVDENGVVKALKAGKAVITLTGANDVTATVVVNVTELPIDTVVLDKLNVIIELGATDQLTAIVKPENTTDDDKSIVWSSSDETVATVDENGVVTAVGGGTAVITATAWNGVKATCEVLVPIHLVSITFDKEITEIQVGTTDSLQVLYNPENTTDAKDIVWTTSNAAVLSVENGVLKALKAGTATITATVGDVVVSCDITVVEAEDTEDGNVVGTGDVSNFTGYMCLLVFGALAFVIAFKRKIMK